MRSVSPHHSRASRHRAPTPHTPPLGIIRAGEGAGGVRRVVQRLRVLGFNEACSTQQRIKGILCFLEAVDGFLVELGAIRGFEYALPVLLQFTPALCVQECDWQYSILKVTHSHRSHAATLHPARIGTASCRACRYFDHIADHVGVPISRTSPAIASYRTRVLQDPSRVDGGFCILHELDLEVPNLIEDGVGGGFGAVFVYQFIRALVIGGAFTALKYEVESVLKVSMSMGLMRFVPPSYCSSRCTHRAPYRCPSWRRC